MATELDGVRLYMASDTETHVPVIAGRHLLFVGIASPDGRALGSTMPARERITLLASECGLRPDTVAVQGGSAIFELGQRFVELACGTTEVRLRSEYEVTNRKVRSLAERLVMVEREGAELAIVRELLWLALARSIGSVFGNLRARSSDGWLNPGALQRSIELVEENLAEDLSVARMAKVAGLSSSAFLRAFRGSTGATPGEFVLERRIALGAGLLSTTDLPISVIAGRAGFKSSNHFATAFAARRRLSPSAYRRRQRLAQGIA